MKKRIVALLLVVALLFSCVMLAGCEENKASGSNDAKKSVAVVVNDALKKNAALDSMAATMKMDMEMTMEGMTLSIPVEAKIKAKNLNSDSMISYIDMTMSMMGQEIAMQMYQEGEWAYMVMSGMEYKVSLKDMQGEMDYAATTKDMLKELPEDIFKGVELVEVEDGSQKVTLKIDGDKFNEIFSDLVEDIGSESAGVVADDIKISDAVINITMVDGFVTVYDMAFSMEMTVEGVVTKTDAKVTINYENPGKDVTITPPEGYKNFEAIDMSSDSLI